MNERPIRKDDFEAEDVSGGEAVFEAVRATGVLSNVAADGANGLRGRIGGVEIVLCGHAAGDVEIDDSRLDNSARVGQIDFEDAVHARETDDDTVLDRKRAAAKACTGTAGDKGD